MGEEVATFEDVWERAARFLDFLYETFLYGFAEVATHWTATSAVESSQ